MSEEERPSDPSHRHRRRTARQRRPLGALLRRIARNIEVLRTTSHEYQGIDHKSIRSVTGCAPDLVVLGMEYLRFSKADGGSPHIVIDLNDGVPPTRQSGLHSATRSSRLAACPEVARYFPQSTPPTGSLVAAERCHISATWPRATREPRPIARVTHALSVTCMERAKGLEPSTFSLGS